MLNDWFTYHYGKCQKALEQSIRAGRLPVLIRLGDDLIQLRGQQRSSARILSERYHALKSVCHIPIALYMDLRDHCGAALGEPDLERLAAVQRDLRAFAAEEAPMQAVLAAADQLIDELRDGAELSHARLARFERQTRDPVRACIHLAARDELTRLHAQVQAFTQSFTADDWRALRVVICGSHQPRYRQSTKQYFKCLLVENHGIEGQVLYAEGCQSEAAALQLLATHLLDRELAKFFLGSPLDLQQDVLGDAAQAVLEELFPDRTAGGSRPRCAPVNAQPEMSRSS